MARCRLMLEFASQFEVRAALRHGAYGCCLLVGLSVWVGCSNLGRQRQRESVVQARQTALRGLDAAQAGQWELAERLYRQAIEVCPIDERARHGYAEALWRQGRPDEAIEQMREAVRLAGNEAAMQVRLGEMFLAVGDYCRAGELADQAATSGRPTAAAYRLKGDVWRAQGAWREALASYHRALTIQGDFAEVQMAIAQLYWEHDRPQRALSTLQSLTGQYPADRRPLQLVFWQGVVLKSLGRTRQAVEFLAEADQRGMRHPDLLYLLAEAHYEAGELAQASLVMQRAREQDPAHPAAATLVQSIEQARTRFANLPR